jgi:hypothetical protein
LAQNPDESFQMPITFKWMDEIDEKGFKNLQVLDISRKKL